MGVNSRVFCSFCDREHSQLVSSRQRRSWPISKVKILPRAANSKISLKERKTQKVFAYQKQQQQDQYLHQEQNLNEEIQQSSNDADLQVDLEDYFQQLMQIQSVDVQLQQQRQIAKQSQSNPLDQEQSRSQLGLDQPETSQSGERPLPTQGEAVVKGGVGQAVQEREVDSGKQLDIDYLQELIAIQQNGPKNIGFFGSRNMGFLHQQLVEVLSYAIVLTGNHVFTSGATGTNAAVIRGALRAEKPELLTVVLPQSLKKQPQESQELLKQVEKVIEMPQNDELSLVEASRICNKDIIERVVQIICFAFHDSSLLLETCREAKISKKMVTLFYLD